MLCRIDGMKVDIIPSALLPPSGLYTPLHVHGEISVTNEKEPAPTLSYQLFDEYRQNQRGARVRVTRSDLGPTWWKFDFDINLKASVSIHDVPGRNYFFVFAAKDSEAPFGKVIPVLVPSEPLTHPRPAPRTAVPAGPRAIRGR